MPLCRPIRPLKNRPPRPDGFSQFPSAADQGESSGRCSQGFLPHPQRALSDRRSADGEPDLPCANQRIFAGDAEEFVAAGGVQFVLSDDRILFCGRARTQFPGCLTSGGASGGGLVVVATGWTLLMQKDDVHEVAPDAQPQDVLRQAFYPLTLPLTVGPGSISVAITLGANSTHRYGVHTLLVIAAVIATALIALSVFLCYGFADRLGRALGKTGMTVTIRLSSFLLVCIGVQIMWNGISGLLSAVTFHVAR